MKQKDKLIVDGITFSTATLFDPNYRERSPVLAKVEIGNKHLRQGQIIVCHHNHFYYPSRFWVEGNTYSIPANHTIFCILTKSRELIPVYGNILCDREEIKTELPLPPEMRKKYIDRVIVRDGGWTPYKKGDLLFTRPHAYYEIVANIDGHETRIHKCHESQVVGLEKNYIRN